MTKLYPLKFTPIIKDKIWGGDKLQKILNKKTTSGKAGESWEISGVNGDISVVAEGFLKDNSLSEIIEIYMGDLVGDSVFEKFGPEFPLLIKFIDANDNLSIQVHPDDVLAMKRHNSFGKTEMWYILQAEEKAKITVGFNKTMEKSEYLKHLKEKSLEKILNIEDTKPGDVFFLPAGRIHAIGAGVLLAEIQQTSDVTYRIYDYDRKDEKGNLRELHTDQALDAIDFNFHRGYKTTYEKLPGRSSNIVSCDYFVTNIIELNTVLNTDYTDKDSFVIYICTDGRFGIKTGFGDTTVMNKGETVLIPAALKELKLIPSGSAKILEVYVP